MFTNISMAGTGGIITIVELVLKMFHIDVPGGQVGEAVNGIVALVGIFYLLYGQLRRPELTAGLIRK